jgi:hypothetical protein
MRIKTAIKVSLLVVLAFFTSWITSSIVAQTKIGRFHRASSQDRENQKPNAVAPLGISTEISNAKAGGNAQGPKVRTPQEVVDEFLRFSAQSEATLSKKLEARINGRQVVVSQTVHVLEKSPNASYVWVLRVYRELHDPSGRGQAREPVLERYYTNQAFQVPANVVEMKPSFTETLVLEPGVYFVRVSLNRMRPGDGLGPVTDESVKQAQDGVSDVTKVVIAD